VNEMWCFKFLFSFPKELRDTFIRLRLNAAPDAIETLFKRVDVDGNNAIDFKEFCGLFVLLEPVDLLRHYATEEDSLVLADLRNLISSRPLLQKETKMSPLAVVKSISGFFLF
jgi:hypothetical protein